MTPTEIKEKWAKLSPRERDAWVAEKVMGWDIVKGCTHNGKAPVYDKINGQLSLTINPFSWRYWSPSSDIFAAWEVIEKTREKIIAKNPLLGRSPAAIFSLSWYGNSNEWGARFCKHADISMTVAPTASEAICLAALIVLEGCP